MDANHQDQAEAVGRQVFLDLQEPAGLGPLVIDEASLRQGGYRPRPPFESTIDLTSARVPIRGLVPMGPRELGELGLAQAIHRLRLTLSDPSTVQVPLFECLAWVCALEQLHEQARDRSICCTVPEGKTLLGLQWVRALAGHELFGPASPPIAPLNLVGAALLGVWATVPGGAPVWRNETDLKSRQERPDPVGRQLYKARLEGRTLPEPIEEILTFLRSLPPLPT